MKVKKDFNQKARRPCFPCLCDLLLHILKRINQWFESICVRPRIISLISLLSAVVTFCLLVTENNSHRCSVVVFSVTPDKYAFFFLSLLRWVRSARGLWRCSRPSSGRAVCCWSASPSPPTTGCWWRRASSCSRTRPPRSRWRCTPACGGSASWQVGNKSVLHYLCCICGYDSDPWPQQHIWCFKHKDDEDVVWFYRLDVLQALKRERGFHSRPRSAGS